ncbi:uncharacterized protein FA14DRAFT_188638 [Meira miltonrushii]|uniref:FAS1 domain-containing protein n=1 Tax=Meira miltonrushii TaxID=1280837 RepID=A0A316VAL2_9BASI|nr:uncharacterized protein FA14DRAFT_188638 [Meira miltonrushii]PWN34556.1 hypothetical protein FA14DRAFT_188638 [Meira miltonrushii]
MKFSIASLLVTLTMGSAAMAAVAPEPATRVEKRQIPTDPAALSSLLANPSAAFAEATSLLANPQVSSEFRQLVTASSFEAEVSSAYVQQLGTKTGEAALSSYKVIVNSLLGESTSAAGSSSTSAGSSNSGSGSSGSSGSGHNGASGILALSAMGSAVVVGAAVVMAAL